MKNSRVSPKASAETTVLMFWAKRCSLIAVALAAVNVFGGFLVTRRMLEMFKKKDRPAKKEGA